MSLPYFNEFENCRNFIKNNQTQEKFENTLIYLTFRSLNELDPIFSKDKDADFEFYKELLSLMSEFIRKYYNIIEELENPENISEYESNPWFFSINYNRWYTFYHSLINLQFIFFNEILLVLHGIIRMKSKKINFHDKLVGVQLLANSTDHLILLLILSYGFWNFYLNSKLFYSDSEISLENYVKKLLLSCGNFEIAEFKILKNRNILKIKLKSRDNIISVLERPLYEKFSTEKSVIKKIYKIYNKELVQKLKTVRNKSILSHGLLLTDLNLRETTKILNSFIDFLEEIMEKLIENLTINSNKFVKRIIDLAHFLNFVPDRFNDPKWYLKIINDISSNQSLFEKIIEMLRKSTRFENLIERFIKLIEKYN
ncbi:MAG: hypothetical protein ACTSRG_18605 [Candidatus Helarchaeota archaeon]